MMLLNCVHGSEERTFVQRMLRQCIYINEAFRSSLMNTPMGNKITIAFLDRVATLSADESDRAERAFDVGYAPSALVHLRHDAHDYSRYQLFTRIVTQGSIVDLYKAIAVWVRFLSTLRLW
jgi:hypothetical protein